MTSYENEMIDEKKRTERVNIPILKYFWQASPLSTNRENSLHSFLRKISVFELFSDFELRQFSNYLHRRDFVAGEKIFEEGDRGFGFYLIYNGHVDIYINGQEADKREHVIQLDKYEYLGELSLLEKNSRRNASAVVADNAVLFALFVPDLEDLIQSRPVIAAKFLQAISFIVAKRFNAVANELSILRNKLDRLEKESDATNS